MLLFIFITLNSSFYHRRGGVAIERGQAIPMVVHAIPLRLEGGWLEHLRLRVGGLRGDLGLYGLRGWLNRLSAREASRLLRDEGSLLFWEIWLIDSKRGVLRHDGLQLDQVVVDGSVGVKFLRLRWLLLALWLLRVLATLWPSWRLLLITLLGVSVFRFECLEHISVTLVLAAKLLVEFLIVWAFIVRDLVCKGNDPGELGDSSLVDVVKEFRDGSVDLDHISKFLNSVQSFLIDLLSSLHVVHHTLALGVVEQEAVDLFIRFGHDQLSRQRQAD